MGVILNIEVGLNDLALVTPVFKCACGMPAAKRVSCSGKHEGKQFYRSDVGYVKNSITDLDTDTEDPSWERHLACDVWVLAEVIDQFTKDVFEVNKLSDADLRASLLGIEIGRFTMGED